MAFCAYCGTQLAEVSYAPCPKCGNPSNGAPRGAPVPGPGIAPAKPAGSSAAPVIIIVIVVVFAVVAIIGILAAIAIPNMLTAMERSKQKRTVADLRSISTACEAYATDNNAYPNVQGADKLGSVLAPTFIREVPVKDAWGHDMRYECWQRERPCDSYAVASAGKDGVFQYESLQEYQTGTAQKFDCDLVYANGRFVQYPEGTQ